MILPRSSISKKAFMAVTGLALCAFLCLHLLGNIVLLLNNDGTVTFSPGGPNSGEFFVWVAHHYEAIPLLFHAGEILILALIGIHAIFGLTLWLQNLRARGGRYLVHRNEGGRTVFSATMPYTGLGFIAVFLVIHLLNFRFGEKENPAELYGLVGAVFGKWYWALVYVVALAGLAIHLSHGFQSAFQSLGFNHPRYTPKVKYLGYVFAGVMFVGFGILPVLFFFNGAMA
jgi:succinate dehydrogenase / fumarate reductase cytochrome b subunit